jgi:hypothetical protein
VESLEITLAPQDLLNRQVVLYYAYEDTYLIHFDHKLTPTEYEEWKKRLPKDAKILLVTYVCEAKGTDRCKGNCDECRLRLETDCKFEEGVVFP